MAQAKQVVALVKNPAPVVHDGLQAAVELTAQATHEDPNN